METYVPPVVTQYCNILVWLMETVPPQERETSLQTLSDALTQNPDLFDMLTHAGYAPRLQERVMTRWAQSLNIHPALQRFLSLLAKRGRLDRLPQILRVHHGRRLGGAQQNIYITTARPLTPQETQDLLARARTWAGPDARLSLQVDPSLLGGSLAFWNGYMRDDSLRTTLNRLHRKNAVNVS